MAVAMLHDSSMTEGSSANGEKITPLYASDGWQKILVPSNPSSLCRAIDRVAGRGRGAVSARTSTGASPGHVTRRAAMISKLSERSRSVVGVKRTLATTRRT